MNTVEDPASQQAVLPLNSSQLFSRHGIVDQMDIMDDSEALTMPTTLRGQSLNTPELVDPHEGTQNLDLLPPGDPSSVLGPDGQQAPVDLYNSGEIETDAFQGALDEFYFDPNSIALDPFNWFSSDRNTGDFGRNQIWAS